jgi:hypothetical protein
MRQGGDHHSPVIQHNSKTGSGGHTTDINNNNKTRHLTRSPRPASNEAPLRHSHHPVVPKQATRETCLVVHHAQLRDRLAESDMAEPLRNHGAAPFAPTYLQAFAKSATSSSSNPYRLDEGYSEDTESRADSRMGDHEAQGQSLLPDWVVTMNETERSGECAPRSML